MRAGEEAESCEAGRVIKENMHIKLTKMVLKGDSRQGFGHITSVS